MQPGQEAISVWRDSAPFWEKHRANIRQMFAPVTQALVEDGQIGVGHAHASKLAVYRQSVDYEVVGVVEPDVRLRQRAEAQPAYKDLPWLTREQLLNGVWGHDVYIEDRTVDVHIGRLRKALSPSGERDPIRTVRGSGYAFDERYQK